MKLPDLTLRLNGVQPNPTEIQANSQYAVGTMEKLTIAPNQQLTLNCILLSKSTKVFTDVCGIVKSGFWRQNRFVYGIVFMKKRLQ